MAIVYKAHDQLLNRNVAVKVLRQQYVHDEDFIRRFRREAQSAASLSHPNVVSIYDVGQHDDIHYIVMEYVEGSNLNEIIKERAPLQVDESIHIAAQICDALEHAHHSGIIHRDIKPHNILIGKNGRVKVTDFGIARAATSSDITQTGSVIGSVHYFSPEHAKGISQGEKSDLYSLGIVMYQMLTNKLPFLGDSPISVALKHLQEPVVDPRQVNPMIPQSVENIILKALRKKPEERYQSAGEMLQDLETALQPERRNEPRVTFTASHEDNDEPTRIMPAIRPTDATASNEGGAEQDPWEKVHEKKRNAWIKPTAWVVVTIVLLASMWYGIQSIKAKLVVPEVKVPEVIGMSLKDAKVELEKVNLQAEVIEEKYDSQAEVDKVLSQDRQPDTMVRENTAIGLVVSLGPKKEKMPSLQDLTVDEAINDLKQLGISDEQIRQEPLKSDEPSGTILQQSPAADEEIIPDQVNVLLVVSEGPGTVPMPDLYNLKESEAKSMLEQYGLIPDFRPEPDYVVEKGRVFHQHPYQPKDPVEPGKTVTVYISTGLPDDALRTTAEILLSPAKEGKASVFHIRVTDATGENVEWGTEEIDQNTLVPIQVVVTQDKNANISVTRDNKWYHNWTVTYTNAQEGGWRDTIPSEEDEGDGNELDPLIGEEDVSSLPDESEHPDGGTD